MEQWKQIQDAPTGWMVSDQGRIKQINEGDEKITKGYRSNNYLATRINNVQKYIHRIVADHWCEGSNDYQCVNHINGIKTDNRAVNLEKVTYKKNNEHAIKTGLNKMIGEDHPNTNVTLEQVHKIYRLKKEGKKLFEIRGIFDLNYGTLKCIYSGKNWKYEYSKFFTEADKKGRHGKDKWNAVPEEKVLEIYALKKQGVKVGEVAKIVGLKRETVGMIYRGKNWSKLYTEHFK